MDSGPCRVTLQQHEFAKYRNHSSWMFMFLTLGAEQIFHLKSIHYEKDEWKIRYYDELIIRTFEQSSLFLTLPLGFAASHIIDNLDHCSIKEAFRYAVPEQSTHTASHPCTMTDQFKHGATPNHFTNGAGIPSKSNTAPPMPPSPAAVNGSTKYCPPAKAKKNSFPNRQTYTPPREPATRDVPMTPLDEQIPAPTGQDKTIPPCAPSSSQKDVCMKGDSTEPTLGTNSILQLPHNVNHTNSAVNGGNLPDPAPNLEYTRHNTSITQVDMKNDPNPKAHEHTSNISNTNDKIDMPDNENTTEGCSRLASDNSKHQTHPTPVHITDDSANAPSGMVTTGGCSRMVTCPIPHHPNDLTSETTLDNLSKQNDGSLPTAALSAHGIPPTNGEDLLPPEQVDHPRVFRLPQTSQGGQNHKLVKSLTITNLGKSPGYNGTIKDLLNRNKSGCPADDNDQEDGTDDEVHFIAFKNATSVRTLEDILLGSDLSGNLVRICNEVIAGWPCSFANVDSEYMAKLAACYSIDFSSHMCYAITALRVLTHAPWNDDMFYGHIRELILCAIGNGWTWKDQSAAVQGRRITTVEVCAALASYRNPQAFPPGQISALDAAIIAVCDDLFPAHVAVLFASFSVHCASCSAQGQVSVSIFDVGLITMPESNTIDLAQMLCERNPRLALDREDIDFAHCNVCADREQLSYDQSTAGLIFILQILSTKDRLPTISQTVELLDQTFDVQNIGSNPACQKFRVSGLIVVQGASSHHFFVIEKVDHDKILLHDNLLGCRWIPINEVRQPARIWGFVLRHNEHAAYSFQPAQYKVIAPNAANPTMHQCKKRLKPKHSTGVDSKKYEFSGMSRRPAKKTLPPDDSLQVDNVAPPSPDDIGTEHPSNPSTSSKSQFAMVNHRGVIMADSASVEQDAQSKDKSIQDQTIVCRHPRVPGADGITDHSHPQEEVSLQMDQGTDDCLKDFGHLKLDNGADVICNPTQEDPQSISPAEPPPPQLLLEGQQASPHQNVTPPQNINHPESNKQSTPSKIPDGIPVMPLPDTNAKPGRESDLPPPQMIDASQFNGKSTKEKEVSPPKRTRFSELHPYAIISLFDGVGSAIPAIAKAVGGPPSIIIAAECDPILRQIVSEQFLFRSDGKWTKSCQSTYTIYTDDVRNLLKENCRILREAFFLAGPHCRWIVVAGSPCQDLTSAGPFQGLLGLTGPCSSMFYYVHIILWILQMNYPIELIRFLLENAGTMLEIHRKAILKALGLNPQTPPDHFRVDPKFSHGIKRNRFYFRNYPDRETVPKAAGLLLTNLEGPLLDQGGEAVPFGPLLRVRAVMGHEVLQLSWTSYQPIALIWDYTFWGGKEQFQCKAKMQFTDTVPSLSFANALLEEFPPSL